MTRLKRSQISVDEETYVGEMRIAVVGLGVQGLKRKLIAGESCVATVDPLNPDADYKSLNELPIDSFDAAFLCVPDSEKAGLIWTLVSEGKHMLVEKPLVIASHMDYSRIEEKARTMRSFVYTAYNHRFEPHLVSVRDELDSGKFGRIYRCSIYYGNGTAALVRQSPWRDTGPGVISDLGSHVLDLLDFWFSRSLEDINLVSSSRYENRSPDHAVFSGSEQSPHVLCEVSMVSWRNYFEANIFCELGSIHVRSLCKWGTSELVIRQRVFPSGIPKETVTSLPQGDPTWRLEFEYFLTAARAGVETNLAKDSRIHEAIERLARQAEAQ